ncbi:HAD family hydrolase [Desulfohalovibrio reitneri]|uniref:HAD family hydrolase n=1 Tax=Desulfohalovibrio reitneri TaxID=1307759 RepID=UPI0004A73AC8|nr:HAD family hydrolase [Desulfohalovibrio reitneri]
MIRVLVFDFDGVIMETVAVKTRAFARSVEDFGPEAVDWLTELHLRHGGVSRYEKFRRFYEEYLGRDITQPDIDMLVGRFLQAAEEELLEAPFVTGAREAIEEAHRTYPIYVASGAPQEELRAICQVKGLTRYFQGIYGSPPEKAELLRRILMESGAQPNETLMIGDSSTDLEAAEAVGTRFYGRGKFPAPHEWAEDLTGLTEWLRMQG